MNALHSQSACLKTKQNKKKTTTFTLIAPGRATSPAGQGAAETSWPGFLLNSYIQLACGPLWPLQHMHDLLLIFFNYIKPSPNCLTCVQKTVLHDCFRISCFHWLFISIILMPDLVNSAAGSVWGGMWSEQILHSGCSSTIWNRPQGQSQQELPVGAFRAIPDLHLQTSCST